MRISRSTKLMSFGILLSLGWFVFESCECEETKEEQFPGFWVACINDKPTLMTYTGDRATSVTDTPAGNFDPSQYSCKHDASSPSYKGSASKSPYTISTPAGPGGSKRPRATAAVTYNYTPQQLLLLPFLPSAHLNPPPSCASPSPDLWQTVQLSAVVTHLSTCPFQIKARIPVVSHPLQVAITPDGSTAIVTSFDNGITFISTSTNQVVFTMMTDPSINPHGLAISSDGTRAYVTSFNPINPVVLVLDITSVTSPKIIATIPTITYPQGATLSPDDSQLWITSPLASSVDIIDTVSLTSAGGLGIGNATDVAFNSTGTQAYVTSAVNTPGTVVEVDTATLQTIKTYTVGAGPTDIAMSYGDQFLVVNNNNEGSISVIDLVKNTVVTNKVGTAPTGIVFLH